MERDKGNLSLVYSPVSLFIPCLFTSNSFDFFVNPNSRFSLSIPFSLSHSLLYISTHICFYRLSIHLYFFTPLCLSRCMPISFYLVVNSNPRLYFLNPFSIYYCTSITFYLFVNPNSRLYLSMFFSLFPYIPHIFPSITFYVFLFLCQSTITSIYINPLLLSLSILRISDYISIFISLNLSSAYVTLSLAY